MLILMVVSFFFFFLIFLLSFFQDYDSVSVSLGRLASYT